MPRVGEQEAVTGLDLAFFEERGDFGNLLRLEDVGRSEVEECPRCRFLLARRAFDDTDMLFRQSLPDLARQMHGPLTRIPLLVLFKPDNMDRHTVCSTVSGRNVR